MVVEDGILVVRLIEMPKPMLAAAVAVGRIRGCAGAGVIVTPPTVLPAKILLQKLIGSVFTQLNKVKIGELELRQR